VEKNPHASEAPFLKLYTIQEMLQDSITPFLTSEGALIFTVNDETRDLWKSKPEDQVFINAML